LNWTQVSKAPMGCGGDIWCAGLGLVSLPRPELRTPEHQDGAPDYRPPGRRGRDPGGFAQAEAFHMEGHAPHPQVQPCGECAHGWRSGAHDSEASGAQEALYDGDLCHGGASPW
jgi:hypothetical protein